MSPDPAQSLLVRAMRRQPVPPTPVWFMRQAGRSLPEYRAAARRHRRCSTPAARPELVTEITLQPVRRHGVDAAILFSDIVLPLRAAGVDLDIVAGRRAGRRGADPHLADVERLPELDPAEVPYVDEAVRALVGELGEDAADRLRRRAVHAGQLPGRGRPVEGPRPHQGADARRRPTCGTRCSPGWPRSPATFLRVQIDAGASARAAVRLVGRRAVRGRLRAVRAAAQLGRARGRWPASGCRGSTSASAPASCCRRWARPARTWSAWTGGCRWTRRPAGSARTGRCRATSTRRCCWPTGRWSSARCAGCWPRGGTRRGHVFNLGHGVLPETDPDVLTRVVDLVRGRPVS